MKYSLWIDVSYNDDGGINSVVVGCYTCGRRAVALDDFEGKSWLRLHNRQWHPTAGNRIEAYSPSKPSSLEAIEVPESINPSTGRDALALLGKPTKTADIANALGANYNTTYVALKRLRNQGIVSSTKIDGLVYWEAA